MKTLLAFLLLSLIAFAQGPSVYPYSVALTWKAPATGVTPTGYNVYRATYVSGCGVYLILNTTAVSSTSYADFTVAPNNQYCYEVTALNGAAESEPDALAPVSIPPAPPTGFGAIVEQSN